MKKRTIKLLSLALAVLMLVPLAVSCKKDPETTPNAGNENVDKGIDYQAILGFGPEDNNGYEFRIILPEEDAKYYVAEGLNSNFVNDALFKRNDAVQNFFNIKLKMQTELGSWKERLGYVEKITTPILAGDNEHDLIFGRTSSMADSLGNDYYLATNTLNFVDLTKEWWMPDQYENLQINGNIYSLFGDMHLSLYSELHSFIFNEQLIENTIGLKSPYQLIKEDQWLYKTVVEYSIAVGSGDGDSDELTSNYALLGNDVYGMVGTVNPQRALATGFNLSVLGRNQSTGVPEFPLELGQNFIEAYMMVYNAFHNNTYNVFLEVEDGDYSEAFNAIADDRLLFLPAHTFFITDPILVGMQGDYGIVPYPKLDSDQTRYYSPLASVTHMTIFPKTLTNVDLSAKVATYMSYVGKEMVVQPYFENYLKDRLARCPEMQEMLDLIRSTATMTLTSVYSGSFTNGPLTLFEVSYVERHWYAEKLGSEYKNRYPTFRTELKKIIKRYRTEA